MLSCKMPTGNSCTSPLLVADFSSCSGESEDNRIRYNLHNCIILSDLGRERDWVWVWILVLLLYLGGGEDGLPLLETRKFYI